MKIENAIGWCDETGNKVTGCDKVSPGCKNCYAQVGTRARVLRADGIETWGPKGQRYPVKDFATKVRRLNKLCVCDKCHQSAIIKRMGDRCYATVGSTLSGLGLGMCDGTLRRIRIFADSNSDWLDDKWPIETLSDLLKDIHDCPNVDFKLLTKRPENWRDRILRAYHVLAELNERGAGMMLKGWLENQPPPNVWLGVSVEDQKRANERIPLLLQIPAKVRFLSVEPLLGPVDLNRICLKNDFCDQCGDQITNSCLDQTAHCSCCVEGDEAVIFGPIDWVIVGGESGKDRRDCGVEAICDVARQCVAAGVKTFVKQDCSLRPGQKGRIPDHIWNLKQFP